MKTMLAARYLAPHRLEAMEIPIPAIGDEEALLEVEACGFCGSDISIVAGTHPRARAPLTLGHELCGRIVEISASRSKVASGDRVAVYPLICCGQCHACTHGNAHVCRNLRLFGFDADGGMAQYVKLPVSSLIKLPEAMPERIGALIEPLAVAVHGVARASLDQVELAVVLCAGPIGLMTALVAQARGVGQVVVSDILASRMELAASLGLRVAAAGEELHNAVMELSNQNGADLLFECAGAPSTAQSMTALVRSRGAIINLGVFKKPVEVDMQSVNFKEIQLLGSRVYERADFAAGIELAKQLPLHRIVTHAFPLQQVSHAFEAFRLGQVCKALIVPAMSV
jgi:(R,R)-butanediol dehydrogenase/meso-butanediol dehydrogenase/diacetyl reductase